MAIKKKAAAAKTAQHAHTTRKAVAVKAKTSAPKAAKKTVATAEVSEKKTAPKHSKQDKFHKIKGILQQQKAALLSEAEVALNELPGQSMFPDMGDQASAETDMNFMLRLRGREQRLLKKIDEAIERIDSGTFGICEDCGLEIDVKRLEARPVTTMCIECKMLQEEEEKRREV